MTIAEIKRAIESKIRVEKREAQQRALLDYIHADLVGRSVGRFLVGNEIDYPTPEEAYSSLFEDKAKIKAEEKAKQQDELSALRFREYANFYNKKHRGEAITNE